MPDRDLHTRTILLTAAAFAATVVLAVAGVLLWLQARNLAPGGERLPRPYDLSVPGPHLQSAPQQDLAAYRAEKQQQLNGLAWVDAAQGIARIPIQDAMALLAKRGSNATEPKP